MVQILGISLLNPFDHIIEEECRAKYYLRYMDDGFVIANTKEELIELEKVAVKKLAEYGMNFHPKKTNIYPLKNGIKILGFTFKLTDSGKVIRLINSQNVKHERKKLVRMAHKVAKGEITVGKYWECFNAWKAHAELGNTYKVVQRMIQYAKQVLKESLDEKQNKDNRTN